MTLNEIAEIYISDKHKSVGHDYIPGYEAIFKDIRMNVKNVLEIGIGCLNHESAMLRISDYKSGNSLRMWRDYFPKAIIYGIDIFSQGMIFGEERIKTLVADQSRLADLHQVMNNIGDKLDIIIDDGSHIAEHQRFSFEVLEQYLQPEGIYVIEDIQPPYIESFINLSIFSPNFSKKLKAEYNMTVFDTRDVTNHPDDILLVFKKRPL